MGVDNDFELNYAQTLDFSSIHRLGLFSMTVTRLPSALSLSPSSAKRSLLGRTGHGSMVDADTVNTDAKNVKPKRDETNVRRWWLEKRRLLAMGIL